MEDYYKVGGLKIFFEANHIVSRHLMPSTHQPH